MKSLSDQSRPENAHFSAIFRAWIANGPADRTCLSHYAGLDGGGGGGARIDLWRRVRTLRYFCIASFGSLDSWEHSVMKGNGRIACMIDGWGRKEGRRESPAPVTASIQANPAWQPHSTPRSALVRRVPFKSDDYRDLFRGKRKKGEGVLATGRSIVCLDRTV